MSAVTGQIAYGLTSPLSGVVEASIVTVVLPCKNEPAAGASTVRAAASASENCAPFRDWASLVSIPAGLGGREPSPLQALITAATTVITAAATARVPYPAPPGVSGSSHR